MSAKQYTRRVTKKGSRYQNDIKDGLNSREVRELPRSVGKKSEFDERRRTRRVTHKTKREPSPRTRSGQSKIPRAVPRGRRTQLRASPRRRISIEKSRSRSVVRKRREDHNKLWLDKPTFRDPSRERYVSKDKVTLRRRRSRSRERSKSRDKSRYPRAGDGTGESSRSLGGRVNSNNKCENRKEGGQRGRRLDETSKRRKKIPSLSPGPQMHPQRRKMVQEQSGNQSSRSNVRRNSLPKQARRNLSPKPARRRDLSPKQARRRDSSLKRARGRDLSPKSSRRRDLSPLPARKRDLSPLPDRYSSQHCNEPLKPTIHPSRRNLVDLDRPRNEKLGSTKDDSRKKPEYRAPPRRESWNDRSGKRAARSRDKDDNPNNRRSTYRRKRSPERDSPKVFPRARKSRDSSRLGGKLNEKSLSPKTRSPLRSRSRSRPTRRSRSHSRSVGESKITTKVRPQSDERKRQSNNHSRDTSDSDSGEQSDRSEGKLTKPKHRSRSVHSTTHSKSSEKTIDVRPKVPIQPKPVRRKGKIKREKVELEDSSEPSPRHQKTKDNPRQGSRSRSRHRSRSPRHRSLSSAQRSRSLSDKSYSRSRSSRSRSKSKRSRSRNSSGYRSPRSWTKSRSRERSLHSISRSQRAPSPKISIDEQNAQHLALLNTHMTKPSRRIYIGNLPIGVGLNGAKIVDFLTQACDIMGIKTQDPIVSCWMSTDKTYCFVEFRGVRDAEESKRLLAENQIKLGERLLRFGWPKDYTAPPPHLVEYVVGGEDPPLPETMTVATIDEVYRQYPKLFKHNEVLRGQRAASILLCGEDITLVKEEIIEPRVRNNTFKGEGGQTRVLLLDKMITREDITKEDTYGQIFGDIKTECKKYGHVRRLLIPRPGYVKGDYGVGKVYVQFEHIESAIIAKEALAKRRFDKREIVATFYDETKFIKNIF